MLWFPLAPSWIESFFSTKNLSFTPLQALATHTLVIVAQNNLQSQMMKTKTLLSFVPRLSHAIFNLKANISITHHRRIFNLSLISVVASGELYNKTH
jgi:hypothetical protein